MVMRNPLTPPGSPPQMVPYILSICWDDLFRELRKYAKPIGVRKAVSPFGNLLAETTTDYKVLKTWEVSQEAEGVLREISLYTSRGSTSMWKLVVADETIFEDAIIHSGSLTIPYKELPVAAKTKYTISVKTTDGVATNFDAIIIAEERFYLE